MQITNRKALGNFDYHPQVPAAKVALKLSSRAKAVLDG